MDVVDDDVDVDDVDVVGSAQQMRMLQPHVSLSAILMRIGHLVVISELLGSSILDSWESSELFPEEVSPITAI